MISFDKVIVNGQERENVFQNWEDAPHPGVFTSFRALIRDEVILVLGFSLHYDRLILGSRFFNLLLPSQQIITREILSGMKSLQIDEARVRIELFSGFYITRLMLVNSLATDAGYFSMRTARVSRPYEELKSTYGAAMSERSQAECDPNCEALFIDDSDNILEGAWSNFGWIEADGSVCFSGRGLDGVTQRVVRDLLLRVGRDVRIVNTTLKELVDRTVTPFITSSLRGIVAVAKIDDVLFSPNADITRFRQQYIDATYQP